MRTARAAAHRALLLLLPPQVLADLVARKTIRWEWMLVVVCFTKAVVATPFSLLYLYTAEAFPTRVRASALGVCTVVTRMGGAITPTVAELMLTNTSGVVTFGVYALASVVATLMSAALPFETRGRDADEEEEKERRAPPTESSPLVVRS